MMTRLERYLFRNLLVATLYSTAGLTVTIWLTQSLRLIEIVVEAGAPLRLFLWLLLLTVPTFLGIVLPIALVGAVLFTYNRLTMDSELVVMRAAGVGPFRLARPALVLAAGVMGIVFLLNVWLTPAAHRELVRLEYAVKNDYSQLFLREGVFNDVGEKLSVYLRSRDQDGNLHGVLIHDARVAGKPVTIMGENAVMVPGEAGARFVVFNGNRQEMDQIKGRLSELYFERYAIDIKLRTDTRGDRWPDARERSMAELLDPPADLAQYDRIVRQMRAELHHRLSSPLFSLAFVLVALASLLSGEFNRRGQASRVTLAILAVVVLQAASLGLTSLSTRMGNFIPLMYLLPLLVLLPAGWVLAGGRRLPRRPAAAAAG
ncbi:LPS export ABC transporter permease LptF [Azospirillum sp. TSO22-1]|uniref:LPS export ABC transporter permease LptF n=1 Tax=Azospirillum sp. TSO22-1 TaxID=716789 RepID=UPI001FFECE0A|nr:LPS export ABC transporter permease LptF [Azospirillum sp. TSO22-1]